MHIVVPVPPSRQRPVQPVRLLGDGLAKRLGLEFAADCVRKIRDLPQLKDVHDYDERTKLLHGAHAIDRSRVVRQRILLFDDLYRSGATLNAVAEVLYDEGGAAEVFALTITRARSKT